MPPKDLLETRRDLAPPDTGPGFWDDRVADLALALEQRQTDGVCAGDLWEERALRQKQLEEQVHARKVAMGACRCPLCNSLLSVLSKASRSSRRRTRMSA